MERFFDIIFSLLAFLVLAPLFLPITIILRFTGEGEIFFSQERIGKSGESFMLLKFATMLKDSPNIGTGTVTMKRDPRVLPFGRILRKTKVNELPQLLNILFGQMSLIGPRPLTKQTFGSYPKATQDVISAVSPGLSGIGSIVFRGEEEIMAGANASVDFYENVIAPYKGALEEWFVSNKNIILYFKAIFITIWVVVFPKSTLPWSVFKGLPEPPDKLKLSLNFVQK